MSVVDVLSVLLGLASAGLGAFQIVTGRTVTRRFGRPVNQPPALFRASGAMFLFLGLAVGLNAFAGPFGHTGHALLGILFATAAIVSATWAFVLFATARST